MAKRECKAAAAAAINQSNGEICLVPSNGGSYQRNFFRQQFIIIKDYTTESLDIYLLKL